MKLIGDTTEAVLRACISAMINTRNEESARSALEMLDASSDYIPDMFRLTEHDHDRKREELLRLAGDLIKANRAKPDKQRLVWTMAYFEGDESSVKEAQRRTMQAEVEYFTSMAAAIIAEVERMSATVVVPKTPMDLEPDFQAYWNSGKAARNSVTLTAEEIARASFHAARCIEPYPTSPII